MTEAFEMPPIGKGDVVLWYPEADVHQDGVPGMVMDVFNRQVNVCCLGSLLTEPKKMSVRHVKDPVLWDDKTQSPNVRRRSGGWDYRPEHKLLLDRMAILERLGMFAEPAASGQPPAASEEPASGKKKTTAKAD